MLIIIYSETNQSNILENLGKPEYSYYFVLKEFRPVLERLVGPTRQLARGAKFTVTASRRR